METDDEFVDIDLRSATEVADRAIVLSTLLQRIALSDDGAVDADDRESAAFDLREWLRGENLWDDLTTSEEAALNHPIAVAIPAELDSFSIGEALAALTWALGLLPSLEPHLMPDYLKLIDEVPTPWDTTSTWIASQRLRPEPDIATERERAELWEWRLAIEMERRVAPVHEIGQIETDIHDANWEAEESGLVGPENVLGDYETWHAISELEDEAISSMRTIAEHRLRALNWVCGFGESWDSVPLEI